MAAAQAVAINGSLTALGKVIRALVTRSPHVPYRDSVLTMLLRSSLEGRAATAVVINVASDPEHDDETLCSLEFGQRMGGVRKTVSRVVAQKGLDAAAAGALRRELQGLNASLARMENEGLDAGHFHPDAVPSEVRSLKTNIQRYTRHASAVKELQKQVAEHSVAGAGKGLEGMRERLVHETAEASNLQSIIEMQKTVPVVRGSTSTIWLGPHREYTAALSRKKEIEDYLALAAC